MQLLVVLGQMLVRSDHRNDLPRTDQGGHRDVSLGESQLSAIFPPPLELWKSPDALVDVRLAIRRLPSIAFTERLEVPSEIQPRPGGAPMIQGTRSCSELLGSSVEKTSISIFSDRFCSSKTHKLRGSPSETSVAWKRSRAVSSIALPGRPWQQAIPSE